MVKRSPRVCQASLGSISSHGKGKTAALGVVTTPVIPATQEHGEFEAGPGKVRETLVKNKMQTKRVEHLPSKLKVLDLGFHAQYHKNKNKKLFKKRNFSENTLN